MINYVALLKKPDLDEATRAQYLDVVDRQSQKLKKLTEDVVEASKAASGVMQVNLEPLDAGEILEQAVGEHSQRLRQAGIEPVVTVPKKTVTLVADGTLLGRVLENLLTNIAKYAQPGTRAYFDLAQGEQGVVFTVKNVSSAPLNISADELMERFVRGDDSRHSEGSGLGLSIAQSLTKLMGGTLTLVLDGDLNSPTSFGGLVGGNIKNRILTQNETVSKRLKRERQSFFVEMSVGDQRSLPQSAGAASSLPEGAKDMVRNTLKKS
jgi:signal transduction histidine kinase